MEGAKEPSFSGNPGDIFLRKMLAIGNILNKLIIESDYIIIPKRDPFAGTLIVWIDDAKSVIV
jgi:hypothetical protein